MGILFINACVRENSRTLILAKHLLSGLDGDIKEVNLPSLNLLPLNSYRISSRLSDAAFQTHAKEFANADIIVIAAPLWDLSFPAILKIYIENITIAGITFKYTEQGIAGLCKAKMLIYISTSGGAFLSDYGYSYIKTLSNSLFGIEETKLFYAQGLDIWGNDVKTILEETKKEIDLFVKK